MQTSCPLAHHGACSAPCDILYVTQRTQSARSRPRTSHAHESRSEPCAHVQQACVSMRGHAGIGRARIFAGKKGSRRAPFGEKALVQLACDEKPERALAQNKWQRSDSRTANARKELRRRCARALRACVWLRARVRSRVMVCACVRVCAYACVRVWACASVSEFGSVE